MADAAKFIYQASELYAKAGDQRNAAKSRVALSWELWHLAQHEAAQTLLLENRDILYRSDAFDTLVVCEATLCLLYLDWGTPLSLSLAAKHSNAALQIARQLRNPYEIVASLHDVAIVKVRQGYPDEALMLTDEMNSLCNAHKLDGLRSNASFCRALAFEAKGQLEQALNLMTEAESLNQITGGAILSNKIGIEIARLTNDTDRALRHLVWFEAKGMLNNVNIIHRYFPALKPNSDHFPIAPASEAMPYLEVLGSIQVTLESQPVRVRGRKRQELLALLLEARISGRSEVSKLELMDKLYPDTDETQATAGIHDVVYQLRSNLGESTLTTTTNGYTLGSLETDVETFLETGNTQLWRGIYLEGVLLETSDTVRENLYLALRTRAEALLETDPNEVARVGRLLCEADPYDLEALRLTVMGLREGQNHRSLARFYDSARKQFLEIGETLPARWQDFLTQIGTTA